MSADVVWLGFLGSLGAGAMTAVGALPALYGRTLDRARGAALLGFAAGVMLAASFFSLLVPSIEQSERLYGPGSAPALIAALGVLLGAGVVAYLNENLPHEHFIQGREGPFDTAIRRVWLFVLAITLHNAPEGMAVGVGFAGGDFNDGLSLAVGIGLQNAPEGLAVAVALRTIGYGRRYAVVAASLTGLVEPIAGLLGAAVVSLSAYLLPWGLAFAAGAMLYVISHEIIPETHRAGRQNQATLGLMIGLAVMIYLDVALG